MFNDDFAVEMFVVIIFFVAVVVVGISDLRESSRSSFHGHEDLIRSVVAREVQDRRDEVYDEKTANRSIDFRESVRWDVEDSDECTDKDDQDVNEDESFRGNLPILCDSFEDSCPADVKENWEHADEMDEVEGLYDQWLPGIDWIEVVDVFCWCAIYANSSKHA